MASGIAGQVKIIAERISRELGLEFVDAEYVKEGGTWFLRVYIYKKEGVNIDDCIAVHKKLDVEIEEIMEDMESYVLEVSSPGYDRGLKTAKDYERYTGKKIEIRLYTSLNGKKKWVGILKEYKEGKIYIETEEGIIEFIENNTAKVKRVFEF